MRTGQQRLGTGAGASVFGEYDCGPLASIAAFCKPAPPRDADCDGWKGCRDRAPGHLDRVFGTSPRHRPPAESAQIRLTRDRLRAGRQETASAGRRRDADCCRRDGGSACDPRRRRSRDCGLLKHRDRLRDRRRRGRPGPGVGLRPKRRRRARFLLQAAAQRGAWAQCLASVGWIDAGGCDCPTRLVAL